MLEIIFKFRGRPHHSDAIGSSPLIRPPSPPHTPYISLKLIDSSFDRPREISTFDPTTENGLISPCILNLHDRKSLADRRQSGLLS